MKTIVAVVSIGVLALTLLSFSSSWLTADELSRTLYVDGALGSDGSNSCLSSASPCQTLQQAINQAQSGDLLLVAAGTYNYRSTDNPCDRYLSRTRAVVCIINKHLTLRGGYASGNWSAANPAANPTVIDGENRVHGVYLLSSDPSKPSEASIDMQGFTVRRGYVEGATSGDDMQTFAFGGGMLTDYAGVKLSGLIFEENVARGGSSTSQHCVHVPR
ncbi:MAG: hypothetical protein ACOYL7_17900, partial [Caldilinea sp.]